MGNAVGRLNHRRTSRRRRSASHERLEELAVARFGRGARLDRPVTDGGVDAGRELRELVRQRGLRVAGGGDSDDACFGDFIEDKSAENPSIGTGTRLLKEKLDQVLGTLNERERRIVEMRFGLVDGYGRTLDELGKYYNVTRERVRQIEAKALRKLRHPTRAFHLKGFLEVAEAAVAA